MSQRLILFLLHWMQAHEGLVWENVVLVASAVLFNSPVPKNWFLLWMRKSLFAIFNRNHPQEQADPKV